MIKPDSRVNLIPMIAYDLICANEHVFECWFKDSASFEEQKSSGIIDCPVCGNREIERVYTPFAVIKGREGKRAERDAHRALQAIQHVLDKHFEDVGSQFAAEALKIHNGETEERNIKGTATPEEEVVLKEEGVRFFKVPTIKHLYN